MQNPACSKLSFTALNVFLLIFAGTHSVQAGALSAQDVMTRNEEARKVDDVTSTATISTGTDEALKTKQFTWWRKLTGDKVHFNTLTRFLSPAEVRGEGILFQEHAGDQNDVQIYLPAYKKIRRVESQQQSGSFMGSEFSYADIAAPHLDEYKYKLQKESECEIESGTKGRCYVVESTPANDIVKDRTGYSKSVQWVRQDNFMVVKGEFYDLNGELKKSMVASQIKEVDAARHKWMAHTIRIENAKTHRYTILQFNNVKVNTGIPDSTFSNQNLARER